MLSSLYHVLECRPIDGPEVFHWVERPMPVPAADEVLIKIAAAGINRADILQRQGKYPPPAGVTDIIGMEVSGEVVAIGEDVKRWKIGDKICALIAGGGYAEYVAVSEGHCLPVPVGISMLEAAAMPEAVATVWANIFEAGALKPGETVLVHGGSSGIGTTAIQMCKLLGSKVFVTVGNEEKAEACRTLGADLVINYKKENFVELVKRQDPKRGVDVILDMVGGDYVSRDLSILAPKGRHVSIAVQGGRTASIDIFDIMQKQLVLTGSTLRHRSKEEKARLMKEVEAKIWPLLALNKLKPLIYTSFPIKNAWEAHKVMESGVHIGKIVLEVTV